jgi:hypothetical protein
MSMRGLLLTMTEPAPEHEEEFNAWYDTEHMAERLSIPGFVSAQRWVAEGRCDRGVAPERRIGRYLATYELERPEVLDAPEYLGHVGDGFTPWSKRCLGRAVVFRRWACEQINPGGALPPAGARAIFLACGDVPAAHEAEFNRWYDEEHVPLLRRVEGVLAARRFRARSGTPRYIALYDLADERAPESPEWRAAVATPWSRRIDELTQDCEWILKTYARYGPG